MSDDFGEDTKVSGLPEEPASIGGRDRAYLIVLVGQSVGEMHRLSKETTVLGRSNLVDIQLIDDGVSRKHAELELRDGEIVLRDLGSRNGTFCNGERIGERVLKDGDKLQVGSTTILKFTFSDALDESFQQQLYDSALRDGLTKAFNKRYLAERLEQEFRFAKRHRSALSLLMIDVDHFKQINDRYGHLAGDYVLAIIGERLGSTIRNEDVLARYGGEEFAILCRGVDLRGAGLFAERLRKLVEGHAFAAGGESMRVTVSIGVALMAVDRMTEP